MNASVTSVLIIEWATWDTMTPVLLTSTSSTNPHNLSLLWVGIAQWLERWIRDWKVACSNPCRCGRIIFFSGVNFLCWFLFQYPFHPRVTAVARKRSRSFCQKCRWQVTAKHAYTLCNVALHEVTWLYGCMVYTELAELSQCQQLRMAAVMPAL